MTFLSGSVMLAHRLISTAVFSGILNQLTIKTCSLLFFSELTKGIVGRLKMGRRVFFRVSCLGFFVSEVIENILNIWIKICILIPLKHEIY